MRRLRSGEITLTTESNTTTRPPNQTSPSMGGLSCPRAKDYWLPTLAPLGKVKNASAFGIASVVSQADMLRVISNRLPGKDTSSIET